MLELSLTDYVIPMLYVLVLRVRKNRMDQRTTETLYKEMMNYIVYVSLSGYSLSQLLGGAAVNPQLIAMTADCSST